MNLSEEDESEVGILVSNQDARDENKVFKEVAQEIKPWCSQIGWSKRLASRT